MFTDPEMVETIIFYVLIIGIGALSAYYGWKSGIIYRLKRNK